MKKRIILWMVCLLLVLTGCSDSKNSRSSSSSKESAPSDPSTQASAVVLPELTVTVMNLGKADAILVEAEGQALLIDTGEDNDGEKILALLKDRGIRQLDYLVLTHLDKDHIGGADQIIKEIPVGRLIQSCNDEDSDEYTEYRAICREKGITPEKLTEIQTFSLAQAEGQLLPAQDCAYSDDNDYSILLELAYGQKRFLFAGDAEEVRLQEYLDQKPGRFDFLKMPHHGRENRLTAAFLQAVRPEYAVITCSKKNPPDDETLVLLEQMQADVFLTSQGFVTASCNGMDLKVKQ